jgi:MATE family multidrug resistance protein
MWTTLVANLLNVVLNWALIYGHLGFPRLEVVGAGIATMTTRVFMFAFLLVLVRMGHLFRDAWVPWSRRAFDLHALGRIVGLGLPVGIQWGLELWAFQVATLMSGTLGASQLAAHTVAINLVSVSFMVPLGISMATVTRVGNLIGESKNRRAQLVSRVAFGMSAGFMVLSAALILILRYPLVGLYSRDAAVIALAASILPIGAAFQIFDGTQVVGGGILRGMGRTRPAAVFNLVAYWVLALPLGWWLAFPLGMGLHGIWWGMAAGLALAAIALVVWVELRGPARVDAKLAEV